MTTTHVLPTQDPDECLRLCTDEELAVIRQHAGNTHEASLPLPPHGLDAVMLEPAVEKVMALPPTNGLDAVMTQM